MSATEQRLKAAAALYGAGAQQAQGSTYEPPGLLKWVLIKLGAALHERDEAVMQRDWAQQSYESLLVRQNEMRERIERVVQRADLGDQQIMAQAATIGMLERRIRELAPQHQFEVMGVYNVRDKKGLRDCMRELPQLGVESVNGKTRIRVGLRACDRKGTR